MLIAQLPPDSQAAILSQTELPDTKFAGGAGCTGTGFVQGCRIWVDNREQTTTYVSATSLTATIAKKALAGTQSVDVKLGGVAVPSTRTITWT